MQTPIQANQSKSTAGHTLLERVSLLGPTPGGLRVLSDVTTSLNNSYRQANVNRLVSIIARAARRLGEDIVFETSDQRLWARLREHLSRLLLGLLRSGALRGQTPAQAFEVRCDRSTMSQNDIDNGRVIALVQFNAAAAIEQITVVLSMDEGGQVSLVSAET
jgi:phage tail sheath protein FI